MSTLNSGVSVSFTTDTGIDSQLVLRLEDEDRNDAKPPYGTGWFRLWNAFPDVKLVSTSGNLVRLVNSACTLDTNGAGTFNDSKVAQLPHPNLTNVKLTPAGVFLDTNGKPIKVNLTVNTKTGEVVASQRCYGAFSATYTTTYARHSCDFLKDPNAVAPQPTANPPISGSVTEFLPQTIVALVTLVGGVRKESVTLSPPDRSENPDDPYNQVGGTGNGNGNSGNTARLKVQLNGKYPVQLDNSSNGRLMARAVFDVFCSGSTSLDIVVTSGSTKLKDGPVPMDIKGEGLSFNNSNSASLQYPPSGSVTIVPGGNFYSVNEGGSFSPGFKAKGDEVQMIEYVGVKNYKLAGRRKLADDEVVVVNLMGHAAASTGTARATYTTTVMTYVVRWDLENLPWFPTINVVVTDSKGASGQLAISPPQRSGV